MSHVKVHNDVAMFCSLNNVALFIEL